MRDDVLMFLNPTLARGGYGLQRDIDTVGPACFLSDFDEAIGYAMAICLPFGSSASAPSTTAFFVLIVRIPDVIPAQYVFADEKFELKNSSGILSGGEGTVTYHGTQQYFTIDIKGFPIAIKCQLQVDVLTFLKLYSSQQNILPRIQTTGKTLMSTLFSELQATCNTRAHIPIVNAKEHN